MSDRRQHISARDARGGEIILMTRAHRLIFVAGTLAMIIAAAIWMLTRG